MIKYQISTHVKNDDLPKLVTGEEYDPKIYYHINYKGIFDTIDEGLETIKKEFEKVIREKHIDDYEIMRCTHKVRIDTNRCRKWEKLFLSKA
jgi:hypothetical protein